VLWVLACAPPADKPPPVDRPDDVATEPCNGVDDDRDGLVDEGNDQDADGIPDCFDVEDCDGIDNDGDGVVDDGFDVDGDGVPDCADVETCDGVDNDGDGEIDEGFSGDCDPCNGLDDNGDGQVDEGHDGDGDGIADCFDAEECDGVDNDGDGLVDEDLDHDWDGLCDALDVEVCDGWDNDGDGLVDEGVGGCWVPEACDGVDNDGDGEIDEGYADVDGDGFADCLASCGTPTAYTLCAYDPAARTFGCSYQTPATVTDPTFGAVAALDLAGWTTVRLTATVSAWSGYVWHLADSETCNGFGGDAGTSVYDAEAHNDVDGTLLVYPGQLAADPVAVDAPGQLAADDALFVQVCQGWIGYRSMSADGPIEASASSMFQWDGNEPDAERVGGVNDTRLWLGIDRMVTDPAARHGTGLEDVALTFGR
jgi:hypothetical protein